MAHLKSWWFRERTFTNFGDELGAAILRKLGHTIEHAPFGEAEILTTGSILQRHNREPLRPGTIIWGTGWHKNPLNNVPRLDIRAVRGAVTASVLNIDTSIPMGDPGLLASHLWRSRPKRHRLGFVRHYVDQRDIYGAHTIDVRKDPAAVCQEISSCEVIVSSSLHGCIVAASYGIPYMRVPHNQVVGGDTKWIDFATSLNRPIETVQQQLLEGIEDL